MSINFSAPTVPEGFTYDPEWKEWDGPKCYAADRQLGAWTTRTPEFGTVITVDTPGAGILHTVDELRMFHSALGDLLSRIEAWSPSK